MTDDLRFEPETLRVSTDTAVVWKNPTSANHTVTAIMERIPENATYFASGNFDSEREARDHSNTGLIRPDETYTHRFREPGTYDYVCLPHEQSGMTGTIVIDAGETK